MSYTPSRLALTTSLSAVQTATNTSKVVIYLDDAAIGFTVRFTVDGSDPDDTKPGGQVKAGGYFDWNFDGRLGDQTLKFKIKADSGAPHATIEVY